MNNFIPKDYKFKKVHRKKNVKLSSTSKILLKENSFGLKAIEYGLLSSKILEITKNMITKKLKKKDGFLKVNCYPNLPITKKSLNMRMGKGVGNIDKWVFLVKKGYIIFELSGVNETTAKSVLLSVSNKLPIKTKFIIK